ncbi:MAG: 50S ribosomal protein L20 [Candidatus Nomurabacteria bacterium]
MARVKRSKIAMKHRRNVLKRAKGYQFGRSKKEVEAKVALRKAGAHAFAHRKDKKNDMRRLWNVRMNAALRELGTTYSKFINAAKVKNMILDRKIMADLAENNPDVFKKVVETVM